MDTQNLLKDEKFWTIILGGIGCLALLWSLIINPSDWPNILITFCSIGVSVIVFIVALTTREKTINIRTLIKKALEKLQKKYNNFLLSPRYNLINYDPENRSGLQYLFITNEKKESTQRVKFIPLEPLDDGIIIIYVQKGTLVYGLKYSSVEANEEAIKSIQKTVADKVKDFLKINYDKYFEILESNDGTTAIKIDFDEEKMKKKKFIKAVYEVSELATTTLLSFKKS